jgi:alpha-D-ribose 1-methylphosphonate 5-triphosphate synthase subunit PhnH
MMPVAAALTPGFADPVFDSQAVFRTILHALAHPGSVHEIPIALDPPAPLTVAAAATCLALLDSETLVWLQTQNEAALAFLRFHCGSPVASLPAAARFAVIHDAATMPVLDAFDAGSDEYPDRSTTLILQVQELMEGSGVTLRGPGIPDRARLNVRGLPDGFWGEWRDNTRRFPCGVDVIFTAGARLAALPRTAHIEV